MIGPAERPERGDDRCAEERRLVAAARSGSVDAFEVLARRYESRLFNFHVRRCRRPADAEDLTQETLLRAWDRIHQYRGERPFAAWLFTIAARLVVTHYRARSRAAEVLERAARLVGNEPVTEPRERLQQLDDAARIWRLADRHLTAAQRSALWLRYGEDFSIEQIASILGRTTAAVSLLLHRGRRRLETLIDPQPAPRPQTAAPGSPLLVAEQT